MRLYGIDSAKIKVIYSGVKFLADSALPKIANFPEKYFLSFGTMEPRKNLDSVIAAYAEYVGLSKNPLPLVIAGARGWKSDFGSIPNAIKNQVFILQSVTEAEKVYLYNHAFALLALSFYEGFGFPILEAASCGVPVISSFATSLGEIGHEFALLVNPFRASQAASAMIALEQDLAYYNELSARARVAATKYTWDSAAKKTLELFNSLKKEV